MDTTDPAQTPQKAKRRTHRGLGYVDACGMVGVKQRSPLVNSVAAPYAADAAVASPHGAMAAPSLAPSPPLSPTAVAPVALVALVDLAAGIGGVPGQRLGTHTAGTGGLTRSTVVGGRASHRQHASGRRGHQQPRMSPQRSVVRVCARARARDHPPLRPPIRLELGELGRKRDIDA